MSIGWLAPFYDRLMAPLESGALGRWRAQIWAEVPQQGVGLEVGAGTGANFRYYPHGTRVIATDLSVGMLGRARAKREGREATLVVSDAQALPFSDGTFDWAAETLVFCEVHDPAAGFRELRRVLRPGGRLVMLEHVRPSGWLGRMADLATAVSAPLWGEHFGRDAEAFARMTGFEIEVKEWLWRDGVVLLVARAPAESP